MTSMEKELERRLPFDRGIDGPTMDTRGKPILKDHGYPVELDKNFVKNYFYDHDYRWFVTESIPFSYEGQLATAISNIDL